MFLLLQSNKFQRSAVPFRSSEQHNFLSFFLSVFLVINFTTTTTTQQQVSYSETQARFVTQYWEEDDGYTTCFISDLSDGWGQEISTWSENIDTTTPGQWVTKSIATGALGGHCQATFKYKFKWTPVGVCSAFFLIQSLLDQIPFNLIPQKQTNYLQAPVVNGASILVKSTAPYLQLSVTGFRLNPDTNSQPTIIISGVSVDCTAYPVISGKSSLATPPPITLLVN